MNEIPKVVFSRTLERADWILQPVALGEGLPLFKDLTAPLRPELVDAQTYDTGASLHTYRPARAAA